MGVLLETIQSPADLKRLNPDEMAVLAAEIRAFLIQTLSKTGGHIGPNLGVVELTIACTTSSTRPPTASSSTSAIRRTFTSCFTGREKQFDTIRQPGGLNGFMLRTESEHDSYGAGHAGTALSAALGMAVARDLAGGTENIIALAGDAAFTNGISFEALNNIADADQAHHHRPQRQRLVHRRERWRHREYFHSIVTNDATNLHDKPQA